VGSADGVTELASLSGAASALRDEIAALPAPREVAAALTR
jgi:hypothetical protein